MNEPVFHGPMFGAGGSTAELAAMKSENDALRRENEELARMTSIHCYQGECCPKQKALQPLNKNVCIECTIEQARESIKDAQAGKGGNNG